jgi:ribulose 1,5-bisphosphate synthetase/thiazole synthase
MPDELSVGSIYTSLVPATVTAEADVVVAGGGTAGCVAAIAAARNGASVILVERQGYLGGMMTAGNAGLTKYIVHEESQTAYGEVLADLGKAPASVQVVGGLPMEITDRLIETGAGIGTCGTAGSYVFTAQADFKALLLAMMEEAGVRLVLHSLLVDVIKDGDRVRAVVTESKSGRQAILADVFVDATGDGDLAAKAGVPYNVGVGPDDVSAADGIPVGTTQSPGALFRVGNVDMARCFDYLLCHPNQFQVQHFALLGLEEAYESFRRGEMMTIVIAVSSHRFQIYNTPIPGVFTLLCSSLKGDGLSVEDLTQLEIAISKAVRSRVETLREELPGFEACFLLDCPEVGVRETRHIGGEHVLDIEDVLLGTEFPDSIGRGCHPIDVSPVPEAVKKHPLPPRWSFTIPFGSLVAKAVDNVLLAGRCISASHEAFGCTRPTVQCMVTGEAAGTAAAMCVQAAVRPRDLDTQALRRRLAEQGVVL